MAALAEMVHARKLALVDASEVIGAAEPLVTAIQRGLRENTARERRRIALVVAFGAWLNVEPHAMTAKHELRVLCPAQRADGALERWIEFGTSPRLDPMRLYADLHAYLVEHAGAAAVGIAVDRAARAVRAAPFDEKGRAKALGHVLLAADDAGVRSASCAVLRREVQALLSVTFAAVPTADQRARDAVVVTLRRILTRDPEIDRPAPVLPWIAWMFLSLVRYRAGQLRFLGRYARAVFSPADVGEAHATSDRIILDGVLRDRGRGLWAGMLRPADRDDGSGRRVSLDPTRLQIDAFARFVLATAETSHVSGRLLRWMPGKAALVAFTARMASSFACQVVTSDFDGLQWLELSADLETFAGLAAGDTSDFFAADDFYDPAFVGTECADPEDIPGSAESLHMSTRAAHERIFDTMIGLGERGVASALPLLYSGAGLAQQLDRLIEARGGDVLCVADVARSVTSSRSVPLPASFRAILDQLDADADPEAFEIVLPVLVRNERIKPTLVADKLRMLCGLTGRGGRWLESPPSGSVLPYVLALEPEAGRALARAYLASHDEGTVARGAATIAAIGAPWALVLLRDARASAAHPWVIDQALGVAERGASTGAASDPRVAAFAQMRERMANEVGDLRAALFAGKL